MAEKCPICYGTGKINTGNSSTAGPIEKRCHGCGGKGWVTVEFAPGPIEPGYDCPLLVLVYD